MGIKIYSEELLQFVDPCTNSMRRFEGGVWKEVKGMFVNGEWVEIECGPYFYLWVKLESTTATLSSSPTIVTGASYCNLTTATSGLYTFKLYKSNSNTEISTPLEPYIGSIDLEFFQMKYASPSALEPDKISLLEFSFDNEDTKIVSVPSYTYIICVDGGSGYPYFDAFGTLIGEQGHDENANIAAIGTMLKRL